MNILVVDDELNVRNTIINIISKNVVYDVNVLQAHSGEEAWEILNSHDVSLLISDIIMDGITGIELARMARQSGMDCEIIFISAYDHKEYLKAAIELDSVGYIDKPIDKNKLLSILNEVFRKRESYADFVIGEKDILKKELVNYLVSSQNDRKQASMLLSQFYGKNADALHFAVGICKFSHKLEDPNLYLALEKKLSINSDALKLIYSRKNKNTYVLVFVSEQSIELKETAFSILTEINEALSSQIKLLISLSRLTDKLCDIHKCYEEAVCLIERGFYGDYGIVSSSLSNETEPMEVIKIIDDFNKVLDITNKTAIFDFLLELYNKIKSSRNLPSNLAVFLFKHLIYQMHLRFYSKTDTEYNQRYDRIENDEFLIFDELYEYSVKEAEDVLESIKVDSIVSKIKSCVKKLHANPEVTLQDISAELNLSIGYICTRFKKSTGMSVNNYLNHVRIEHAKELLKNGQYSSEQITYMIGYTDPNYFSRSFKKTTGMTVSEYRKKLSDENR